MLLFLSLVALCCLCDPIAWQTCPGSTGATVECTQISVPLSHSENTGKVVLLRVSRSRYVSPTATGADDSIAVWELSDLRDQLINSATLTTSLPALAQAYKADVYTMEVRGSSIKTERSPTQFANAVELKKIYDALSESDRVLLGYVDWTQIAKDLAFVIDAVRKEKTPAQPFFFNAHGLGTYLANRYLLLHRATPSALPVAVLGDSAIFGPSGIALDISMLRQQWLYDLLIECEEDSYCKTRMTNNSVHLMEDTIAMLAGGYCNELVDKLGGIDVVKWSLFQGFQQRSYFPLALILVYRLRKCDWADVLFFNNVFIRDDSPFALAELYLRTTTTHGRAENPPTLLAYHLQGELARNPGLSSRDVKQLLSQGLLGAYNDSESEHLYRAKQDSASFWPWPNSSVTFEYSASTVPWFLISGELDYQTPLAIQLQIASDLDASKSLLNHLVVASSDHMPGITSPCGREATAAFFLSRGKLANSTCAYNESLAWYGDGNLMTLLGYKYTRNLWLVAFVYDTFFLMTLLVCVVIAALCILSGVFIAWIYVRRRRIEDARELSNTHERECVLLLDGDGSGGEDVLSM